MSSEINLNLNTATTPLKGKQPNVEARSELTPVTEPVVKAADLLSYMLGKTGDSRTNNELKREDLIATDAPSSKEWDGVTKADRRTESSSGSMVQAAAGETKNFTNDEAQEDQKEVNTRPLIKETPILAEETPVDENKVDDAWERYSFS